MEFLNIIDYTDCIGCGACSAVCPRSCISMDEDRFGFRIPMVDGSVCVHCGLCEKACPVLNSDCSASSPEPLRIVAAKNLDRNVAIKSSSGGVFSAFAEYILDKGGAVYGVALTSDLKAEHIRIDCHEDICRIRGSKYLHSDATDAYKSVRNDLKTGKHVLFSGTPCQVRALRQFLCKEYSNLLCIEVVCHGVPTDMAFRKYIGYLQDRHKSRVISVNFRDKSKGWADNCISFIFENGKQLIQRGADNLYTQGYVNNLFVRDSCIACRFKSMRSGADITLGDMWGIENILPTYSKDCGVSMVSINSLAGETAFKDIEDRISDCTEVSYEEVKRYNACIYRSVAGHEKRVAVLESLPNLQFNILIKDTLGINYGTVFSKRLKEFRARIISFLVRIRHGILNLKGRNG